MLAFSGALYAADFGTYAYIHQSLNAGVLEFLRNPIISWHTVWESYHVVWFALAIVAVLTIAIVMLRRAGLRDSSDALPRLRVARFAFVLLLAACIYGKFSRYRCGGATRTSAAIRSSASWH